MLRDDARVGQQVENAAVAQMRGADGIAVSPGGKRLGEQVVKVLPNDRHFRGVENA